MNVEEKVQAVLLANAALVAIVDASNISVGDGNRQGVTGQYIVHQSITVQPIYTTEGLANLKKWTYQVDCFAQGFGLTGFQKAKEVAVAVRNALGSYRGPGNINSRWIQDVKAFYLADRDLHQIPVEFEINESL